MTVGSKKMIFSSTLMKIDEIVIKLWPKSDFFQKGVKFGTKMLVTQ